ncbi:hypothetical protein CspHIS471_0202250 [Cutaneotrichosporon sp. HIS471]|nr:hypothetical protein CspHIS471_0202250 [Cutaneotrichosporon sp. HIS471]
MSRPAELLAADRDRLYPHFETYRLRPLDPDTDVRAYPLPNLATASRVSYTSQQLGFREVRGRIAWDHLDSLGRKGVYVDAEWNVVCFELNDALEPTFITLATLPTPIASEVVVAEYPRALPLRDGVWAVSSGTGSLYILTEGGFTARYDLQDGPFLLYAAHGEGSSSTFRLLLSRAIVHNVDAGKFTARQTTFELVQVSVDTSATNGVDDGPGVLEPNWRLEGSDLPYWTVWAEGGWLVLSEEPFGVEKLPTKSKDTPAQRAARLKAEADAKRGVGARVEEIVDDNPDEEEVEMADATVPFNWTQEAGSVSITVPLPAGTPKTALAVVIQPGSLRVSVQSDVPDLSGWLAHEHSFWSDIIADESTWTYDSVSGELEISLAKRDGDMRWPSVFVPGDDSDDSDDDVPESFSAAEMDSIRASFSRAQLSTSDEPPVPPSSMPALLREEMDIDSDDDDDEDRGVGRICVIGHITDGKAVWTGQPATVLSLPLVQAGDLLGAGIVVKQAVDGLLFCPSGDPARTPWTHIATNPALAFVMSSKRDLRLVRHIHDTVLGFDSGSGTGTGNAYVYYPPENSETARQGVVGVSGGARGALLGVCSVTAAGREVVVALCECALVVLGGIV